MVRFQNWWKSDRLTVFRIVVAASVLLAPAWSAVEIPTGTQIQLRLKTKVASNSSKPKDPVQAIVIEPVIVNGHFVIPAGTAMRGVVQTVKPTTKPDERALLVLNFSELDLGGSKAPIHAQVANVDNARESVDDKGQIQGILASETISARLDQGIDKLAERYSGLAGVLAAAKGSFLKATEGDIVYEPGVELTVKLTKPLSLKQDTGSSGLPNLQPITSPQQLIDMVTSEPFQTVAQSPPKPSDVTNLMFIGSQEQVQQAFAAAGWVSAAELSTQSKIETFKSIAELRGYKEAPVSILMLDGKPPDMTFEKLNNTFAMRHHLRIWRRPVTFEGKPVWVCAATHDIGIDFSPQDRTFIHKIDPNIDRERAKVVNDLLLTGNVKALALVDRPAVPQESQNATGDKLLTDARMAVLIF